MYSVPLVTDIISASQSYESEASHQDHYKTFFTHYLEYKEASGRGLFPRKMWPED